MTNDQINTAFPYDCIFTQSRFYPLWEGAAPYLISLFFLCY